MNYRDDYSDWAQDYDLFGEIESVNEAERDFLDKTFKEYGAKTVLDCACGTGQHLIMLSKLGYKICGSDFSDTMLEACGKNLDHFGINAVVKQCDYRNLSECWAQKFDAVLCLTQALNHMHEQEDAIAALKSMRERLNKNGVLILTQSTTHKTLRDEYRFNLVVNNPAFTRLFVRDIGEAFQTIHILDIFHDGEKNEMKKHDIRIKIILDEEFVFLLEQAGFSKIELYGSYDKEPYDRETSMKLIAAARP